MSANNGSSNFEVGVLSGLVDFGFTKYSTPKLIKILYILSFIFTCLAALMYLFIGISAGGFVAAMAVIGVPIFTLLSLIYVRVLMEVLSVVFRIGDSSAQMVQLLSGQRAGGPPQGMGGPGMGGPAMGGPAGGPPPGIGGPQGGPPQGQPPQGQPPQGQPPQQPSPQGPPPQ